MYDRPRMSYPGSREEEGRGLGLSWYLEVGEGGKSASIQQGLGGAHL